MSLLESNCYVHLLTRSSSQLGHTQWQTKEEKAQFLGQLKIKE